jgi:hypothetical protein
MGLSLEVGMLADLRENDFEGYERYRNQFELLNEYLGEIGLPSHHEPENCEIWSCEMYGYSGLHYLRRIAAHIDLKGILPSVGSKENLDDMFLENYYIYAENRNTNILAKLFQSKYKFRVNHLILHSDADGFYLPINFDKVLYTDPELEIAGNTVGSAMQLLRECERLASILEIPPDINEQSDELWEAADSQGESSIQWQKYGIESFTCVHLIKACRKSIETGAAIVFT